MSQWTVMTVSLVLVSGFTAGTSAFSGGLTVRPESAWPQDARIQDDEEAKPGAVRIRGRLIVEDESFQVDLAGVEMVLEEMVAAPQPPLPSNFQEMTIEQRQKWFQEFQASDAGKKYQEQLQKLDAARRKFSVETDEEGKFVFESGFPATFGLFGHKEFERNGKTYLADFFAEVPVGEGVRFLDLGDLPLSVRRILQIGESSPELLLRPANEANAASPAKHDLKQYLGKPVLLFFWTRDSLERVRPEVDKVAENKPQGTVVVGINLDPPSPELSQFFSTAKLQWLSLSTSGMANAPCVVDYGIMAIPAFCLLDATGNVLLNDEAFYEALSAENSTMVDVVSTATTKK